VIKQKISDELIYKCEYSVQGYNNNNCLDILLLAKFSREDKQNAINSSTKE